MALTYSKQLYLHLTKHAKRNVFPSLGSHIQNFPSVVHCSTQSETSRKKLSKAMERYLEEGVKYDKFIKEQLEEYNLGKEFLANMMGRKVQEMTQKDVDEAIEYLFPSALYVPKSRPMMKPPQEVFQKQKEALFDYSGRPFHFLFYTTKPKYSQCLHDAASLLESLHQRVKKRETPPAALVLPVGEWISKSKLEKLLLEPLYDIEYEKFIEVFTKLSQHPFALNAESFIKPYWIVSKYSSVLDIPVTAVNEQGVNVIKVEGAKKKTCEATVTLKHPGKGDIRINNLGLDYFSNMQRREQIIFPLILTDMLGQVDVEATIKGSGDASQAAAIRYGISKALQSIVSKSMLLRLKVAGLLQKDIRKKERKKPGREGARRRYTWLKR